MSLTFQTQCFWCNDDVFFHRNKEGGCVLFDKLGPPWPIHPCWEEHQEQRARAIDKALADHATYLKTLKTMDEGVILKETLRGITKSHVDAKDTKEPLHLEGVVVADDRVAFIRTLCNGREELVTGLLLETADGHTYRVLVDAQIRAMAGVHCFVRLTCSVTKRSKAQILFATEMTLLEPNEAPLTVVAELTPEDAVSSKWCVSQGRSWKQGYIPAKPDKGIAP
jgi:hypothetical protein